MNILIVYDTKHGSVEECVGLLTSRLSGSVETYKLSSGLPLPDLDAYDAVVVGGSIHAGSLQTTVKNYCEKELGRLRRKRVGLFVCSMTPPEKAGMYLSRYPKGIYDHAAVKECFGGSVRFENMNPIERFLMKKILKSGENVETIDRKRIDGFVSAFEGT